MLNTKSNRLAVFNFKNSLFHLGTAYIWYFAIIFLLPQILSLLMSQHLTTGMSWASFFTQIIAVAFFYTLADCLLFNYDNFKLAIQNGISRRTAWVARVKGILMLTIMIIIAELLDTMFDKGAFLYAGMFGNPSGLQWVVAVIFDLLALFSLFATFLAIGYGLALLSKRGKLIVIIGVPIVGIFLLVPLVRVLIKLNLNGELVGAVIKVLIGYSDKTGAMSPLNISLFVIVWLALTLLASFFFSSKLKLRRD